MKIKILCIGKLKEKWLVQACEEYLKRLSRFAKVEVIEKPDAPDHYTAEKAKQLEAEALISALDKRDYVIFCDLHGKAYTSEAFSDFLMQSLERGQAQVTFVIAGSHGFAESVQHWAKGRVAFSAFTFTHQMTRVLLLEQLYRAFKIARGETYHK